MMNRSLLILISLIFILSCQVQKKFTLINYAYLYDNEKSYLSFDCMVYHTNDTISTTYFKLDLLNLLYEKPSENSSFTARFRIKYELFESYKGMNIIDSASFIFSDSLNFGEEAEYINQFPIKAAFSDDYLLNVTLTDLNRKVSTSRLFNIYKSNKGTRQYFMIKNEDGYPIFRNYISKNEKIAISYLGDTKETLSVRHYNRDFPIAQPPFTQNANTKFNYNADSTFSVKLMDNETGPINLPNVGFYHFQSQSETKDGVTIYRFNDDFPDITNSYQAFLPLRYLTTSKEYEAMEKNKDKKMVVDEFWLKTAGNPARAKILISKFYNNIRKANIYFSSYIEGWKTDRGIIYSVYGPPDLVYKNGNNETWTYGEKGNLLSIKFSFTKVSNPFSDNDFALNKAPVYKDNWYMTVESWRR